MKKWTFFGALLALVLLCAGVAAAQGNNRIDGKVLDDQGKPMPDAAVTLKSEDTAQTYSFKTDKDGKFVQLGLRAGIYDVSVTPNRANLPPFTQRFQVKEGQSGTLVIDYKQLMEQYKNSPEAKERAEAENAFKTMKVHFDSGVQSMKQADALAAQAKTATGDQKTTLETQRVAACTSAANDFSQASQGVPPKQTKNLVVVLGNLSAADSCAGKYDDSVAALQKAIAAEPSGPLYEQLGTSTANAAAAQTDPSTLQSKVTDAEAACDKAQGLDPNSGKTCWKNVGAVLWNKGHQKEAGTAFEKVTTLDPKDAQAWYYVGSSLAAQIDSKQEGGKEVYVIPPGTSDAYQKCIDADPNGPYAPQCKAGLDEVAQLSGGQSTTLKTKKKRQ